MTTRQEFYKAYSLIRKRGRQYNYFYRPAEATIRLKITNILDSMNPRVTGFAHRSLINRGKV